MSGLSCVKYFQYDVEGHTFIILIEKAKIIFFNCCDSWLILHVHLQIKLDTVVEVLDWRDAVHWNALIQSEVQLSVCLKASTGFILHLLQWNPNICLPWNQHAVQIGLSAINHCCQYSIISHAGLPFITQNTQLSVLMSCVSCANLINYWELGCMDDKEIGRTHLCSSCSQESILEIRKCWNSFYYLWFLYYWLFGQIWLASTLNVLPE